MKLLTFISLKRLYNYSHKLSQENAISFSATDKIETRNNSSRQQQHQQKKKSKMRFKWDKETLKNEH